MNGGYTHEDHCKFSKGVVNTAFSLDDEKEPRNLKVRSDQARKHLPHEDLLFVAHDGTGGSILLMLSGEHRGEVWHQAGSDARPPGSNPRVAWHDRREMSKLADNLGRFHAVVGACAVNALRALQPVQRVTPPLWEVALDLDPHRGDQLIHLV